MLLSCGAAELWRRTPTTSARHEQVSELVKFQGSPRTGKQVSYWQETTRAM